MSKSPNNYHEIVRSSSIVGGAQVIIYVIGLVRVKLAAVLLGPAGVGLLGLYQSVSVLVGMLAGLGIDSSGVREVAQADSSGDPAKVASTVETLRRASWVSGSLGLVLMAALAWPVGRWVFESDEDLGALAALGIGLLLTAVDAGEAAILRGTRRIGDLARRNILAAFGGTIASVVLYLWLGDDGIVPGLVVSAALGLVVSRWYARRVVVGRANLPWRETWAQSTRLVGLGLAFMWSGLLAAGVALAIRALVVRELGVAANGIYQGAWGISGMFAGFILSAMGSDFYPRLTSVAHDNARMNEFVNQQTEVGVLLALPGLLGTLAFAPWAMAAFYSTDFVSGSDLLAWFVVGSFGRVVAWPMGFVLLAKGASRSFALTETGFNAGLLVLTVFCVDRMGLVGVAVAFAALYAVYTVAMFLVVHQLCGFVWSRGPLRLLSLSAVLVAAGVALQTLLSGPAQIVAGVFLCSATALLTARGLVRRLGPEHRISRTLRGIPPARWVLGPR